MAGGKEPIWIPDNTTKLNMTAFCKLAEKRHGLTFPSYRELHQWSICQPEQFWRLCAENVGLLWEKPPSPDPILSYDPGDLSRVSWFQGSTLNYARNLIGEGPDDAPLVTSLWEGALAPETLTRGQLRDWCIGLALRLREQGVGPGDVVVGSLPNTWHAVAAMLATTALGAVWSSCSPDFGVQGLLDRFGQLSPKFMFFCTSYRYGGKVCDTRTILKEARRALNTLQGVVTLDLAEKGDVPGCTPWKELSPGESTAFEFFPVAFDDPLFVLFSSGTTGVPKSIVHRAGGTLLQHKKELMLHGNVSESSNLLYYTTCGWMMWNWMVSALSTGSRLTLYDGSPGYPDPGALWEMTERFKVTHLGTSPKYIASCINRDVRPECTQLETIFSTGAPLLPEHYDWVYKHFPKVHLASISGGTDLISCFVLGHPGLPVYRGEIQCAGLGMAVEAWDSSGKRVLGEKGELVCTMPFVSMPLGFLHDEQGERYREAYFNYFPGPMVWRHGDYIAETENGGFVIYGRSDTTLNPGGVRVGTAELYRVTESFPEIEDALAAGRQVDGDVDIWLFIQMRSQKERFTTLAQRLRDAIRSKLTPRHVPKVIIQVSGIPYTRSGKKMEMVAVKALAGVPVDNATAAANPEAVMEIQNIVKERIEDDRQ